MPLDEFYIKAQEAIDEEKDICFDVAADCGQMFGNVKHMGWFVRMVAEALEDEYCGVYQSSNRAKNKS
jgi:hypothetical protein